MSALFLTISFPILGAFILPFFSLKIKRYLSVSILGLTFIFSLFVVPVVLKYNDLVFLRYITEWFSLSFVADGLSAFMAVLSSFVAFLIGIYSLEYMKRYNQAGEFFFWMVLFVGSMMGLIFSASFLLIFCFWEMTSMCSWRLIAFYRKKEDLRAADKAFLITFCGASAMLAGIVLVYLTFGTLELSILKGMALFNLAAFLILCGILAKSAQLPLQSWLPDAGVAPTPVTALLHAAVLVKIGIYVFARIFGLTFVASPLFLNITIALSVLTIIVAAGSALVENNIKRILAYSTISQLGYILLALALNTNISLQIALIYILAHSLAKAGLFLCAGIIEHRTGIKDINKLGGLIKFMPYTAAAYLLCAFSIIGIPPFLGFWPKFMVILLSVQGGHIFAATAAIIGALFTLFYLMRVFNRVFLGQPLNTAEEGKKSLMVWTVVVLGALSLLLGLFFKLPVIFVEGLLK